MAKIERIAQAIWSSVGFLVVLVGVVTIAAVRAQMPDGAFAGDAAALRLSGTAALEAAMRVGGSGLRFEVTQESILYAKIDGPQIGLTDPADPGKVAAFVSEYHVGTVLSQGGIDSKAFWMEIAIARDESGEFSRGDLFARVLERDGLVWRDDGVGWYVTDASPGLGMDPATARMLPSLLESLGDVALLEPRPVEGRMLSGLHGTAGRAVYPGVIAADGAGFTEETFGVDCWFDEQGRLVRLEARARNLNEDTYDLIISTVVTFSYGDAGEAFDPSPTMRPEAFPTSEPDNPAGPA